MTDHIDTYLAKLAARGCSPLTLKAYRLDLRQAEMALDIQLHQVTPDELDRHLEQLRRAGASATTIRRKQASVRGFFRYLIKADLHQVDPTVRLEPPKMKDRLPIVMRQRQVAQLLAVIAYYSTTAMELRDAAAVATLYYTGCRAAELVGLDVERVDLEAMELRLIGKGDRERVVPIHEKLAPLLAAWLKVRPGKPDAGPVFVTIRAPHRRIGYGALSKLFKKMLVRAGLSGLFTPHKLRHTYATRLLLAKVDITKIQKLLGHRKIDTTTVYAQADMGGDLRGSIDRAL